MRALGGPEEEQDDMPEGIEGLEGLDDYAKL